MSRKTEEQSHNAASPATGLACYKKICEEKTTTFMDDVKEYMEAIYSASMEEHKTCFKNTLDKMIEKSKQVVEKSKEIVEKFSRSWEVDSSASQTEKK